LLKCKKVGDDRSLASPAVWKRAVRDRFVGGVNVVNVSGSKAMGEKCESAMVIVAFIESERTRWSRGEPKMAPSSRELRYG
jgi:hypothetical protein